ncbi:MAG: tRNA (adenosine(37)-N6)-threonylcarbamoyltransferase complex transferase subunit TsaD [Patescibacteria group bacterium]
MRILAIETSCDETAMAILEATGGLKSPRFKVLKNVVSSQIETHRQWGGVVPNLAKREHLKNLPIVFEETVGKNPKLFKPDILSVTVGPGLEPCLWTGIEFAKIIRKKYFPKAKFIGVNHMEGHLYSNLIQNKKISFPAVALIVSGGHTIIAALKSLTEWKKIGETRDDAVGECFDKVGRMLNLPFPGGPEIEKMAKNGNPTAINFPRPMINSKDYDFSFSGLKTSVLYYMRDSRQLLSKNAVVLPQRDKTPLDSRPRSSAQSGHPARSASETFSRKAAASIPDICASFQKAAVDVLVAKTARATLACGAKSILLAGGVAANGYLRKELAAQAKKIRAEFFAPDMAYNTDNAAMIGAAAYISYSLKKNRKITANSNLNL